jgi:hypothetical protein
MNPSDLLVLRALVLWLQAPADPWDRSERSRLHHPRIPIQQTLWQPSLKSSSTCMP